MVGALGSLASLLAPSGESMPVHLTFDRPAIKAYPTVEQGQRILYMEASNEHRDFQGERIMASALEESIPYFLKFGRIDLDHASVTKEIRGQRVNPYAWEIGRPLDARVRDGAVWVKAGIFSSNDRSGAPNRFTEAADIFWDSLHTTPPVLWYPSIAGDVYQGGDRTVGGPEGETVEVTRLRWHSVGLSRTPVNQSVQPVTTVPLRAFAKAFGSLGELKVALRSLAPGSVPVSEPLDHRDPDVASILSVINDTPVDAGLDALIEIASLRGIPKEHALATVLALLSV